MIELIFMNNDKIYKLKYMELSQYWFLSNEEGEGMGISHKGIFDILDKYFKENI